MTRTWHEIMTIAGDQRISDKRFRWIFTQLTRVAFLGKMMKYRLQILREQAIIETERDQIDNREE